MPKSHILITGALDQSALEAFQNNPAFEVDYQPDCSREKLLELVQNAHVLVSRSETTVDKQVIDSAPSLKVVARAAVGVGNIDIEYATEKGILVINCPGKNTNSAAELTFGLLLAMFRNIPTAHAHLKKGGWDRHMFSGRELNGKAIGIVGLGNVGHRVAKFARGFDMEVLGYDPYISPDVFQRHGVRHVESLETLAESVDVLSVHVPLNKETTGLINADIINRMKPGSYLVNAARGGVIVESAIIDALKNGKIAGAAIDTFENEPKPRKDLIESDKVWCTQHIGASTLEAQVAIGKTVYDQVCKALDGGVVDYPVNLPNVGVPDNNLLKSYSILAQKLGSMVGQVLDFNPKVMELHYRGDLAGNDVSLVRLGLMKGYTSHVVDDYVSFVNTTNHFKKLGINLVETEDPDFSSYKSALKVIVKGGTNEVLSIGGIVFDDKIIRISLINEFYFEIDPVGNLLILENHDRPGVIGDVGHYLAKHGINIDNFNLSRNRRGGIAMAVIRTDADVTAQQLQGLRQIENVVSVKAVTL